MATVFRLRYIYAGSRLIFVEQPDSDKYGAAHSDLALGQALVGFLSPDSKFPGASTEITLSATAKAQINGSDFAEMRGKILVSHNAIGHAYIIRFDSVRGGFALNDAASPLNTEIKQAGAQNKLIISPAAELINTRARLADASERILTRHKGKTLVSPVAKFGDSSTDVIFGQKNATFKSASSFGGASTGAAFGESVAGSKIAASAFGGFSTDVTISHTVKGYVEQPKVDLPAAVYDPRTDISTFEALQLNIPFSYIDDQEQLQYATSMEARYEYIPGFHAYGWVLSFDTVQVGLSLGTLFWGCPSITVTQTTPVPVDQFYIFFRYFQRVTA